MDMPGTNSPVQDSPQNSERPKTTRGRKRGCGRGSSGREDSETVSQQGQSSQRPNRGRGRGKRPANNDGGAPAKVLKKISDVTNYVNKSASKPAVSASDESDVCPVCLDPPVHESRLDCGHTYCFLCAKGLAESGNPSCSLCRRPIPIGFFNLPKLIKRRSIGATTSENISLSQTPSATTAWYYEGKNGWWMFEERHSADIEAAFEAGRPHTELLICGQIYFINLQAMTQFRKDFPTRIRRIKRDLVSAQSIGVAGLVAAD